MQQRVIIAMALSTNPALLILDEPTTGLDATVEAEVLDLIGRLRAEFNNSILFISHSLPVVARMCDRVGVLYAGELVEEGPAASVFRDPRHPYTVGLMRCVPAYGRRKNQGRLETIPGFLPRSGIDHRPLRVRRVAAATRPSAAAAKRRRCLDLGGRLSRCFYPERARNCLTRAERRSAAAAARAAGRALMHASGARVQPERRRRPERRRTRRRRACCCARGICPRPTRSRARRSRRCMRSRSISRPGETLGLVGESGSGKSSLAKLLLGLSRPDGGSEIELAGEAAAAARPGSDAGAAQGAADRLSESGLGAESVADRAPADRALAAAGGTVRAGAGSAAARARRLGAPDRAASGREAAAALRRT